MWISRGYPISFLYRFDKGIHPGMACFDWGTKVWICPGLIIEGSFKYLAWKGSSYMRYQFLASPRQIWLWWRGLQSWISRKLVSYHQWPSNPCDGLIAAILDLYPHVGNHMQSHTCRDQKPHFQVHPGSKSKHLKQNTNNNNNHNSITTITITIQFFGLAHHPTTGENTPFSGRLYVAGGFDGIRDLASAEVYDPRRPSGGSPWGLRDGNPWGSAIHNLGICDDCQIKPWWFHGDFTWEWISMCNFHTFWGGVWYRGVGLIVIPMVGFGRTPCFTDGN